MSRYPILCRHCGAPIVQMGTDSVGRPLWRHKISHGHYNANCPEPLRTKAEPET